jgi:4-amino-4-deoxy-L-arabinose transferase-like glycosyltransferase
MRPAAWLLGARPYVLLAALCLLLYLPGIASIPPLDRDEARFAQATRQMLESGDFLRIRFQNEARNSKPAGIYWLQAGFVGLVSTPGSSAIWPYRLPSVVGALAASVLVFGIGRGLFRDNPGTPAADPLMPHRIGLTAAVLLACALGVIAEAHMAKTDAALLATVTAAQGMLGLAYVRSRMGLPVSRWLAVMFWAAEIAAILLKGPVGPMLAVLTVAGLTIADRDARWLRDLRPLAGLAVLAAIVVPWLIAIQHATEGQFLAGSLGHDLGAKLIGGQEGHGAPPLSYLLLAVLTFWPGSLLLVPGLVRAWQCRRQPVERFLLAWFVPAWVLFELVPTKLPHYVLPLYPALALLSAAALVEGHALTGAWVHRLNIAVRALWLLASLALAALLIGLPLRFADGPTAVGIFAALFLVALAVASLWLRLGPVARTALVAGLALAFALPAGLGVLPGLDRLWLSRSAAALVAGRPAPAGRLFSVGYGEPSLVFLLGTDLRIAGPSAAAAGLGTGGEALVSDRAAANFLGALQARGLTARALGSVAGIDYSNGQHLVLTLYDVGPS